MLTVSNGATPTMIAVSAASIVATFSVVLSFILFRRTLRHKTLMVAIFFQMVSQLVSAMATIVGDPLTGSNECYYEGIVSNIFILSGVFWTTVITYLLYVNLRFKTNVMKKLDVKYYYVTFGIPVLVTFLPFINSTYAYVPGMWRCAPANASDVSMQLFWMWFSFYGWIWACMVACAYMSVSVFATLIKARGTKSYELFKTTVRQYSGYMAILAMCWLPSTIVDTMTAVAPTTVFSPGVYHFAAAMSCGVGLVSTVYFWLTERNIIGWWRQFLRSGCDAQYITAPKEVLSSFRSSAFRSRRSAGSNNSVRRGGSDSDRDGGGLMVPLSARLADAVMGRQDMMPLNVSALGGGIGATSTTRPTSARPPSAPTSARTSFRRGNHEEKSHERSKPTNAGDKYLVTGAVVPMADQSGQEPNTALAPDAGSAPADLSGLGDFQAKQAARLEIIRQSTRDAPGTGTAGAPDAAASAPSAP